MSVLQIGLLTPVTSVAGTPGQVLINGQYAAVNGAVTVSLDGAATGATGIYAAIASTGQQLVGLVYGGDTNLSGALVSMSGQLVTQIQSAAGVLSLNGVTGLLTLTSAPANANYVKVTTSGTTIMVSGNTTPLLSGVSLPGGGGFTGDGGNLYLIQGALVGPTAGTFNINTAQNRSLVFNGNGGNPTASFASSFSAVTIGTTANSNNGILQLVIHSTSGGGIGLGPDNSIWRTAPNQVTYNGTLNLTGLVFPGGGRLTGDGGDLFLTAGGAGIAVLSNANVGVARLRLTGSSTRTDYYDSNGGSTSRHWAFLTSQVAEGDAGFWVGNSVGADPSVGINALQFVRNGDATFASGLFFGNTGNYTPSSAASIAQLLTLSGQVFNGGSAGNVVYTTGNQTINGVKTIAGVNFIVTGGNVGIGTGSPSKNLSVYNSNQNETAISIENDSPFGSASLLFKRQRLGGLTPGGLVRMLSNSGSASASLEILTNTSLDPGSGTALSTARAGLRIVSTGPGIDGAYTEVLRFSGNSAADASDVLEPQLRFTSINNTAAETQYGKVGAWVSSWTAGAVSGDLTFYSRPNAGLTERMRILANGNVGIGTTGAQERLHVSGGNLRVDGLGYFTGAVGIGTLIPSQKLEVVGGSVQIDNNRSLNSRVLGGTSRSLIGSDTSSFVYVGDSASWSGILFYPGASEAMRLSQAGNLGIGLTNPTSKLVVSGTALFTNVVTGNASITARSYIAQVSGVAIPLIGASLTGTHNVDFTNSPGLQTITITGATLFSGVNYVAGGAATLRVNVSGANSVPVRFPDTWNWVSSMPTGLATDRFAILTLNTFTANDSGVCSAWAVAP